MGLLDDAIREHLELKRRRGADPTEIEREEVEALGPVRRGDVDLADGPGAPPDEADLEPAAHDEPESVHVGHDHDEPVPDEGLVHHDAPYAEAEDQTATPPHGDPWTQQATREFSSEELGQALSDRGGGRREAGPEPPEEAPRPPAAGPDPDVVPADDDAEDVLEETPDFLQETPEHDRLWFEQKPPKDFDF
ncbi:hypothetical protein FSW04_04475 [Baekduia soli]|uniref:DUF5709 domain-containing protein n=1 Tax=Baekduia soli TaxID=496014 RepID=A0A5B8U1T1_9ACTN|nr:hypothetical protein [Baekduia soli]QEC46918.1 hypothetical protein FSW04_04475 [Baekduia soli]